MMKLIKNCENLLDGSNDNPLRQTFHSFPNSPAMLPFMYISKQCNYVVVLISNFFKINVFC